MPYQVPRVDHPWRQYKVWFDKGIRKKLQGQDEEIKEKEAKEDLKPIRQFLGEIVESWERIEIFTYCYGREDNFTLKSLPQYKIAAWLAGILKRNYGQEKPNY